MGQTCGHLPYYRRRSPRKALGAGRSVDVHCCLARVDWRDHFGLLYSSAPGDERGSDRGPPVRIVSPFFLCPSLLLIPILGESGSRRKDEAGH